ncbi:hypothetical protein EXE48_06715 [Halorubrum sp. ASP1]|uniref:hypothetical protein n=1 Tax=Halorubrum sp. ASP1 TaxID=2518114 RepID=UPI0010F93BA3|nr:hypothetical protein [Halorubrum sp. ASP1]TKX62355.1 hypothetical protein EXE48_06715 [Halorubrum sp. ASP1]
MSVNVADDANAYVGVDPTVGQHSNFATEVDGEVTVALDGDGSRGAGVNTNARTFLSEVFRVKNQGKEDAIFYVAPKSVTVDGNHPVASAPYNGKEGDFVDFYASNIPGGAESPAATYAPDGFSLTAFYRPGQGGLDDLNGEGPYNAFSAAEMKSAFDRYVSSSVIDNNDSYEEGSDIYTLSPGESFDFGIHINTDGDRDLSDVSLTLKAASVDTL